MNDARHQCLPKPWKWNWWWRKSLLLGAFTSVVLVMYAGRCAWTSNLHVVTAGAFYRSGQMSGPTLSDVVQRLGIRSIVNLRGNNERARWYRKEVEVSKALQVRHVDRRLSAGEELTVDEMTELVALLRGLPKPLLVHCQGGADRSGLVAALYEFAVENRPADLAAKELTPWYGHLPFIRPKVLAMDRSFWKFVEQRGERDAAQQDPH